VVKALIDVLQQSPALLVAIAVLLGLMVGSFLNVVVHRVPKMMERQWRAEHAEMNGQETPPAERFNLVVPRSKCPACGHGITALENIPLVSYLVLAASARRAKPGSPRAIPLSRG